LRDETRTGDAQQYYSGADEPNAREHPFPIPRREPCRQPEQCERCNAHEHGPECSGKIERKMSGADSIVRAVMEATRQRPLADQSAGVQNEFGTALSDYGGRKRQQ